MFSDAEQLVVELLRDGPKICLLVANTVEGKPLDVRADVRSQMLGAFHQRPECIAEDSDVLRIDVLEGRPVQGGNRVFGRQGISGQQRRVLSGCLEMPLSRSSQWLF